MQYETFEQIQRRAYEIFEARIKAGGPDDPVSDWLQAERELNGVDIENSTTPALRTKAVGSNGTGRTRHRAPMRKE